MGKGFYDEVVRLLRDVGYRHDGGAKHQKWCHVGGAACLIIIAGASIQMFLGDPKATQTALFRLFGGPGLARLSHLIHPAAVLILAGP